MKRFVIPWPRDDAAWRALRESEGLPEPTFFNAICAEVTLPEQWVVLPSGVPHVFIIYNDCGDSRGMVYLDEKIGFTIIDSPNKK